VLLHMDSFSTGVITRYLNLSYVSVTLFQNSSLCNHFLMLISLNDYFSFTSIQKEVRKTSKI